MGRTHHRVITLWLAGAVILASALSLVSSVASSPMMAQARAAGASDSLSLRRQRLLLFEKSFRPSTYDAPLPAIASDTSQADLMTSSGLTSAQPETTQGFRIQVMNTNSFEESSSMRTTLLELFDTWWVYVLYDAPTYKVRIGDFGTRIEAKRALEEIQQKGFPNAWLVPDKVVLHLPPRMPLAQPIDSILAR